MVVTTIVRMAEGIATAVQALDSSRRQDVMVPSTIQIATRLDERERLRSFAASLAMEATAQIIADKLDKKANENLVDQAIKDIGKNIH